MWIRPGSTWRAMCRIAYFQRTLGLSDRSPAMNTASRPSQSSTVNAANGSRPDLVHRSKCTSAMTRAFMRDLSVWHRDQELAALQAAVAEQDELCLSFQPQPDY